MERHPIDPIALVAGLVTLAGGVIALLHQTGTVELGAEATAIVACIMLGVAGAAGVMCARIGADRSPSAGSTSAVAGDTAPHAGGSE